LKLEVKQAMSICSTAAPHTSGGIKPIFVPALEAFKALGVGVTTGWKLINQKKIKTAYIGNRCLVSVESLEQLAADLLDEKSDRPLRSGLNEATAASLASPKRRRSRHPAPQAQK
jgi:hypothetical protein